MRLAEFVFWGSLAIPLYAYLFYPLVIWFCSRCARGPAAANAEGEIEWPSVTLLITAERDEHSIVERFENAVALDYPRSRLQILVGCVGEDDLTGLLARSFDKRRVDVRQFPKRGEAYAVNACMRQAKGDIVLFSDARTLMRPDALRRLVRHFDNPAVGGVSGKRVEIDSTTSRLFDPRVWRFENFLTRCERRLNVARFVSRGIYAIRRELFVPLPETERSVDSAIARSIDRQGYRLLHDEGTIATAKPQAFGKRLSLIERVRAGTGRDFRSSWPGAGIWRSAVSFTFWSHTVLRRLCPAFLMSAFISNACLMDDAFYLHCMLFHELVYVATLIGLFLLMARRRRWLRWDPLKPLLATDDSVGGAGVLAAPASVPTGASNRA